MSARFIIDGTTHEVTIIARHPFLTVEVDGRRHVVRDMRDHDRGCLEIDGEPVRFAHAATDEMAMVRLAGRTHRLARIDPRAEAAGNVASDDVIRAPMPGSVVSVHYAPGDAVHEGDTIVTIESMKLQTALTSPRDGTLAEVIAAAGETFDKDAVIARLAPLEEEAAQ